MLFCGLENKLKEVKQNCEGKPDPHSHDIELKPTKEQDL